MKYNYPVFLALILIYPFISWAQSPQEHRRVEEGKRDDLRSTEVRAPMEKPEPASFIAPEEHVYLAELMLRRVTFGYDICKVITILMGVENQYLSLDAQVVFLKERELLPKNIFETFDPMEPLRKGLASYIFYKALDIKGGAIITLFGVSQRYALKELAYQGIMASGNVNDIVSGDELISALTQAANHLAEKKQSNQTEIKKQ